MFFVFWILERENYLVTRIHIQNQEKILDIYFYIQTPS